MKILVIGLDAATLDLIEPWASEGHLPSLRRLIDEGSSARLLSTPNMHSASAWTSILTGLNPGRHGLFVFSDRDFTTGRQVFFKGSDRAGETVASMLARNGLSAGFLNVPMTYRAQCQPGGFMISGLDAPSLDQHAFCPAGLRDEVFARFPNYGFTPRGLGDLMSAGRVPKAVAAWLDLTETQTLAAEYLIESHPTDFFMTVYTASDWAGHNLWRTADGLQGEQSELLLSVYRALDRAIDRLLKHTDQSTQVFVISDHGIGRHTGASYHLAEWLEAHGYMKRNRSRSARASFVDAGRRTAKSFLPAAFREKIKAGLGAERIKRLDASRKDSFYSTIDWSQTRAYGEPGRHVINVNLKDRNCAGIVDSDQYESLCDRIASDLQDWTDVKGAKVVDRVIRRDEAFWGPFTERASDLYVHWNGDAELGEPPAEIRSRGLWWNGDHRLEGMLIAEGPGIRPRARLVSASVCDLVPTILYASGVPVPDRLDGAVVENMFASEFLERNPLRLDTAPAGQPTDSSTLSEAEEKMIEEKLRGLGYL